MLEGASAPLIRGLGAEMGEVVARVHARNGVDVRCGVQVAGIEGADGRVDRRSPGRRRGRSRRRRRRRHRRVAGDGLARRQWPRAPRRHRLRRSRCGPRRGSTPRATAPGGSTSCSASPARRCASSTGRTPPSRAPRRPRTCWPSSPASRPTPYAPVPFFWSDQFDSRIQFVGRAHGDDEVRVVAGDLDGSFVALYGHGGRLRGVLGVNMPKPVMRCRKLLGRAGIMGGSMWIDATATRAINLSGSNSTFAVVTLTTYDTISIPASSPCRCSPCQPWCCRARSSPSPSSSDAARAAVACRLCRRRPSGAAQRRRRRHRRRRPVPNTGAMPNGEMAAIVQAEVRARIVARHPSERGSDHVDVDAARRRPPHSARRGGHPRAARRARGDRQAPRQPPPARDPAHRRRPRPAGRRRHDVERGRPRPSGCGAARRRCRRARRAGHRLGQGPPRRAAGHRADPRRRHRGRRQAAARVPAAPAAGGDPQGARRGRRRRRRRVPHQGSPSSTLPEKAANAVDKEIDRLERMGQQSPEHAWIRTWLDRIFELPWGTRTDDQLDLDQARAVLDADHYGLDDVKDRIVEFLAVRKLRVGPRRCQPTDVPDSGQSGAVLTLVGPPGVGKTSLGESVARAMGRKFVRVVARRRSRRGRDPRPPAHLRRQPAGSHRPGDHRGRDR